MGNTLTEPNKSKAYERFEYYMFEMQDDTSKMIYHMLDPWIVDNLSEKEKTIAQGILMARLDKEHDRRWLWALGEIASDDVYDYLISKYEAEKDDDLKVEYAYYLILIDREAPVLEYLQSVIGSEHDEEMRMRALSTLLFLYDHEFESAERRNLYATILFDAMSQPSKRLRLYAYDILKDYYQMKEFTPKRDPVLEMLSQEENPEEHAKAAEAFEERIRSMEVVPIKREFIVKWLKNLPHNPPAIALEDCDVCKDIPEKSAADLTRGESLDLFTDKLEVVVRFAYYKNKVLRCSQCGRFYSYNYEYEFLVPRSEEDEYLARIKPSSIMKTVDAFLKFYDFKKIVTCGNFLKLTY